MKKLVLLIGVLVVASGLLWIGQGLGYVKWPATSFMIDQTIWAYYGAGLSVFGLFLIWWSRR